MEMLMPCEAPVKTCPSPFLKFYYTVRPTIPRPVQILLRRMISEGIRQRSKPRWPISCSAATPPADWRGWKGDLPFALVLTHDVERQAGYDKHRDLMRIEKEMGFVSSFNFVPERYRIRVDDLDELKRQGFEVGVHGLNHDGKLLQSEKIFRERAKKINGYIRKWGACGFRAPSMHHDLELFKELDIEYDLSTFDTDPFEPQSDGVNTIFPFRVFRNAGTIAYWEFPYTLPQDNTLFIILGEKTTDIWKRKADWIAAKGGMVLVNVHPDYIRFKGRPRGFEEYPVDHYIDFLDHMKQNHGGRFWNPLPREMARYLNDTYSNRADTHPEDYSAFSGSAG